MRGRIRGKECHVNYLEVKMLIWTFDAPKESRHGQDEKECVAFVDEMLASTKTNGFIFDPDVTDERAVTHVIDQ